MVGSHNAMMLLLLLLLSVIRTVAGVNGKGDRMFSERGYSITYPCEEDYGEDSGKVCFYVWAISTNRQSDRVAIVSNGELQNDASEDNECNMQIGNLTEEHVGHHICHQRAKAPSSHNIAPELNLKPNTTVSLQCVLLTYMEQGQCYTHRQQRVGLTWVDDTGAVVREDSRHHVKHQSECKTTLTVSLQRSREETFRCRANVDERTQTSPDLTVGGPGLQKRGRRFKIESEHQGHNQYMVGGAVGVGGCVVVTAVVAVFVMNKRRTSVLVPKSLLPDEPSSVQSTYNNVVDTNDLTYANIVFSPGSPRAWFHECESTEYACVRYA